jgi:hypothetical protein|nr:hypothetical protein [uncultured Mediterranean phage uvMED]BAR27439.1 hypothetical protein [uncultured Mediterranean phage uvMED]BAR27463.1 hypothetical protein [uncultured Mediterranean phage uvMED]BAR27503.1 hypothetical protein [uncultured Mediterranean phage uvMED]BAR27539.1 hypothetical protein [uncultured Mediterranean phage uvMED]
MTKFRRIINGECSFQMIELFDDVKKAANNSNDGEFVECKIEDLKIDFTTVKKEHDGTNPIASAKAEGSSSEETYGISGS